MPWCSGRSDADVRLVGLFLLGALPALAAPPPGADPSSPMARWYHGLKQPNGAGCCDQSDCRPTEARRVDGGWEARLPDGDWVIVPPDKVLANEAHPGGAAVLCYTPWNGVLCFVPPQAGG